MNIDRSTFLALTVSIAAVACTAPEGDDATASDDVVGGAVCFNGGEELAPIAEGTCERLWAEAQEQDYTYLTTSYVYLASGSKTIEDHLGCKAESPSHPAAQGVETCPTYRADFAYDRCRAYATLYKTPAALDAIACLQKADLTNSGIVYACGSDALDKACFGQPDAEATCQRIEAARSKAGAPLSEPEKKQCRTRVGALRAAARDQLVSIAQGDRFYNMHSAVEGLRFVWPTTERVPSTDGGSGNLGF